MASRGHGPSVGAYPRNAWASNSGLPNCMAMAGFAPARYGRFASQPRVGFEPNGLVNAFLWSFSPLPVTICYDGRPHWKLYLNPVTASTMGRNHYSMIAQHFSSLFRHSCQIVKELYLMQSFTIYYGYTMILFTMSIKNITFGKNKLFLTLGLTEYMLS